MGDTVDEEGTHFLERERAMKEKHFVHPEFTKCKHEPFFFLYESERKSFHSGKFTLGKCHAGTGPPS